MKIKQSNNVKPSILKGILIFGCLLAAFSLYGQTAGTSPKMELVEEKPRFCRNELSVWGSAAASTLYHDLTFGSWSPRLGGSFGLGYTFYFSRHFGLLAGGELACYSGRIKIDGLTDSYEITDPIDGNDVDYRMRFNNYRETQRTFNVNIPVALQFQTGGEHKFFASLGFKLGIPVHSRYRVPGSSQIVTSGYYPIWNQELFEPAYLGYGTFSGRNSGKDIDFGLSYMGTVEAGVKWRLSRVLSLYTGLYFEYGFNDIVDERNNKFLVFNPENPADFTVNSALTSQYTQNGRTQSFVDHVSPAAAGLKVRLGFNLCRKPKEVVIVKPPSRVKPPVGPKKEPAEPRRLSDEEIIESLRRLVSEYGSSVRDVITIELDGFELNSTRLTPRMERALSERAAQIRRTYGTNIMIICEGHTCNLGSEQANMRLGQQRADAVREFLIRREGFNPNHVVAVSKGSSAPLVPNTSEANRRVNRRVVLIVRDL
jgi:outer membrane protein OmpA-like peptidoglycan-associated protein